MGIINLGELLKDGTKSKWKQYKSLQKEIQKWNNDRNTW